MALAQKKVSPSQAGAQPAPAPAQQAGGRGNAAQGEKVGRAKDPAEAKADALAQQVVVAAERGAGAQGPAAAGEGAGQDAGQSAKEDTGKGAGAAGGVPADIAAAFAAIAGFDVGGVSLTVGGAADQRAEQLGAAGYAEDGAAFLSSRAYKPGQREGKLLLAHELAHVALGHATGAQPTRLKPTGTSLQRGSEGPEVRRVQERLLALGFMSTRDFNTGPGVFGPRTEASVTAFQASRKLAVDGVVGPATLAALGTSSAPAVAPTKAKTGERDEGSALTGKPPLRKGSEGVLVKQLQRRLNRYGASLGLDGEFGAVTERAVMAFQKANSMEQDGVVGPKTAAALSGEGARSVSAAPVKAPADDGGSASADVPTGELNVDDADPKGILSSNKVNPQVKRMAARTLTKLQGLGYSPYLFEGHRTMERQNDLYAKGRTKPGSVVTYVKGGGSWHNYGLAVDIVFWNRSHSGPSWDAPSKQWQAVGREGKAAGFTRWMGDGGWDFPHLEYHPKWGNTASTLTSTYNSGGLDAVWKKVM